MNLLQTNRLPWLVAGMIALLGVLAVLQYRWIGQLSRAESVRMETNMQASVKRFSEEVEAAFQQIRNAFNYPAGLADDPQVLLQLGLQRWQTENPHAALIGPIYWVNLDENASPILHQFDLATNTLNAGIWPTHLTSWKRYFEENRIKEQRLETNRTRIQYERVPAPKTPFALAIPQIPFGAFHIARQDVRAERATIPIQLRYVLVMINETYLRESLFPALARQYFANDNQQFDYDLMIRERVAPQQVLYASAPHMINLEPADFSSFDTSTTLGHEHASGTSIFLMSQRPQINVEVEARRDTVARISQAFSYEVHEEELTAQTDISLQHGTLNFLNSPADPFAYFGRLDSLSVFDSLITPNRDRWALHVRHKAGSLAAAVTQQQTRNLALSFGIFLILGGAMVLIVTSAQRAQKVADQQMEFIAGVSHEFRTPLAVIQSAGENLADGVIQDPEQTAQYGTLIQTEGERLSGMVEQVLALAGAQSGQKQYIFQSVDLIELAQKILNQYQPKLTEQDFTLTTHWPETLPVVSADPEAIRTVLRNVVDNALKYHEGTRHLHCSANANDAEVALTIRDRGMGIPPEELPHLFEPFYRGERVRNQQMPGNGLGLKLVETIMRAHGGSVSVQSTVGEGSTFTLHFPRPAPTSEAIP